MAIIEIRGGPITHRYLMNKSKHDLASMYMDLLRLHERRVAELEDAGKILANAEEHYRKQHDLHGDGDMRTGRAWDLMRRAGDNMRDALPAPPDGEE